MPFSSKLHSPQDLYRFLVFFMLVQLGTLLLGAWKFHLFDPQTRIPVLVMVLFFNGIVLSLFRKTVHMNHDILSLTLQAQQCSHLKNEMESYRRHRHDMKNHLFVLHELALEGSIDELKDYVQQYSHQVLDRSLADISTGTDELDLLLLSKIEYGRNQGISVDCSGAIQIRIRPKRIPDIISLLGNVLDNALEAAVSVEAPESRHVKLHFSEDPLDLTIVVTNPFSSGMKPDPELLFDSGYSRKDPDRGRGLTIVRELMRRLDGELQIHLYEESFFQVTLEIPKHQLV